MPKGRPPWYVIQIVGKWWDRPWYWWHTYQGPPVVYLTRKDAEVQAKAFRKQYRGKPWGQGYGRLSVKVVKINAE
ncbi:hypothetical protein LCGC14_3001770 [marine sediment metagenome]|uniref:Uncharacterized protein n=1 Tax=marine sediment metagenome TaxID=412755 RepID=A0A0F8X196_9ZZZZ